MHLKQKGRSPNKYLDEVRNIERDLPTELESQVVNQLLAGLDDEIIQVVGAMCGEGMKTVSHVIRMVESATGDKEIGPNMNTWNKPSRYQGLNPKDRIITELVEESKLPNAKITTQQTEFAKAISKAIQDLIKQLGTFELIPQWWSSRSSFS